MTGRTYSSEAAELICGTKEPAAEITRLRAGDLLAELIDGNLRHIFWGDIEVLRGIGFVVRDTRWGTLSPTLSDVTVTQKKDRFDVTYDGLCDGPDGAFAFSARIEGRFDGTLSFRVHGTAPGGIRTNRLGLVVLHPLTGVVGRALTVGHGEGPATKTGFPELVEPRSPATDIARLTHSPREGLDLSVTFEGGLFEMEDHRNWTDASFKTYFRPLRMGFPYTIAAAEKVGQGVVVAIDGAAPRPRPASDRVTVSLGDPGGTIPRLGLFIGDERGEDLSAVAPLIRDVAPAFVLLRLVMSGAEPATRFAELRDLARASACPAALEVVVPGRDATAELAPLAEWMTAGTDWVESLMIVPARDLKTRTPETIPDCEQTLEAILAAARGLFSGLRIGGGMTVPFSELNRNRPAKGIDFVTHATQATLHDCDDVSVMETLAALPHVFATVRAIVGDIPYRIGPATIGMPASASASTPVANPDGRRICMAENDPRQGSLFGAAFALGLAATAAANGIDAVTLAAPVGPFGMVGDGYLSRPIAWVVAGLAGLRECGMIAATSSASDRLAVLAVRRGDGVELWLANLTDRALTVEIGDMTHEKSETLAAGSLTQSSDPRRVLAGSGPIVLAAYAVSCVTGRAGKSGNEEAAQ